MNLHPTLAGVVLAAVAVTGGTPVRQLCHGGTPASGSRAGLPASARHRTTARFGVATPKCNEGGQTRHVMIVQEGGQGRGTPPGGVPIRFPGRGTLVPAGPAAGTPVQRSRSENLPPDVRAALDELSRVRRGRTMYFRAGFAIQSWRSSSSAGPVSSAVVPASAAVGPGSSAGVPSAATALGWPDPGRTAFWLVAELDGAIARKTVVPEDLRVSATITDAAGRTLATATGVVSATAPTCVIRFPTASAAPGEYAISLTVKSSGQSMADEVRVTVPPAEALLASPLVLRSGPFTGAAFEATADPRFRKAERVRADVPLARAPDAVAARVLDRYGRPLRVPATARLRVEEGVSIASAEAALAPMAPGDYLIEVTARFGASEAKVLAAFRIVP